MPEFGVKEKKGNCPNCSATATACDMRPTGVARRCCGPCKRHETEHPVTFVDTWGTPFTHFVDVVLQNGDGARKYTYSAEVANRWVEHYEKKGGIAEVIPL